MLTLELECKVISQMSALVISSKEPQSVWIPDLQRPEVEHTFDTEVSSINVVSEKKISRLSGVATNFKQLHQIVILAVNITTNCDRCIHLQKIGFLLQHLCSFLDNVQGLFFRETSFSVEVLL